MAKISSYSQITTPTTNDLLLGTDVGDDNKTKNFPIADVGTVLGLPLSVSVTLTISQLLTLESQAVTILSNVGAGKFITIDSVYCKLNFASTAYDFTQDIGVGVYNPSVYPQRSFVMVKEFANAVTAITRQLEPVYIVSGLGGGLSIAENGGIFIQGDLTGANPTQGDSTLTITAYYKLFDANMLPLTS